MTDPNVCSVLYDFKGGHSDFSHLTELNKIRDSQTVTTLEDYCSPTIYISRKFI